MDDVRNQRRRTVPEAEQMEPEMEDSWEGSSHTGSGSSRTGSFASGSHSRSSHSRSSRFEIGQAEADVRQRRNREAAKDYRRRKKEYVTELQANVKQLEREKKELAQRMDTLESENRKLQMMFASPEVRVNRLCVCLRGRGAGAQESPVEVRAQTLHRANTNTVGRGTDHHA